MSRRHVADPMLASPRLSDSDFGHQPSSRVQASAAAVPRDWAHLIDYSDTPWDLPQATEPLRKHRAQQHRRHRHVQRRRRSQQQRNESPSSSAMHGAASLSPSTSPRAGVRPHRHHRSPHEPRQHHHHHHSNQTYEPSASSIPTQQTDVPRQAEARQWRDHNGVVHSMYVESVVSPSHTSPSTHAVNNKDGKHGVAIPFRLAKQLTAKLPSWKAGSGVIRRRHSAGSVRNNNATDVPRISSSSARRASLHGAAVRLPRVRSLFHHKSRSRSTAEEEEEDRYSEY
jgi:hypothetical protein